MQVEFRVEVRCCHLSGALEAQAHYRGRRNARVWIVSSPTMNPPIPFVADQGFSVSSNVTMITTKKSHPADPPGLPSPLDFSFEKGFGEVPIARDRFG
jgi:hypothetical protein